MSLIVAAPIIAISSLGFGLKPRRRKHHLNPTAGIHEIVAGDQNSLGICLKGSARRPEAASFTLCCKHR